MKRFVMLATVMLIAVSVGAQEYRTPKMEVRPQTDVAMKAVWRHTYVAADTVVTTGKFRDTVYSPWYETPAGSRCFFTYYIDGRHAYMENGYKDTLRPNDSLNLNFQTSVAGDFVVTTTNLGTYLPSATDLDSVLQYVATLARDTIVMRAPLIRAMVVMMDSSAAARPNLVGNTYTTSITLFLTAKP